MTQYQYLTGTIDKSQLGQRLDQALTKLFPNYSRSRIKSWILNSRVKVSGQIITIPKKKIFGGEYVEIQSIIDDLHWEAQDIKLDIIYEDHDIIIINKLRNLVVHPGTGNINGTLLNALLYYYPPIANVPRAGIVHRLDKDTTGLMVVAKTVLAQTRLVKLLLKQKIIREYEAVAVGTMTAGGAVNQPLARSVIKRTHMAVYPRGKHAVTHYRIIEHFRAHTRLRLRTETGRTHQVRVHMAYINHPLVGDPLYGKRSQILKGASKDFNKVLCCFNRQALHATMLRFPHPITFIDMEWHAPLPQDMTKLIDMLKIDMKQFKCQMN